MHIRTFEDFIGLINNHDAEELGSMMSDDHLFTDAQGISLHGKEAVVAAWKRYFKMFPDYWITITEIVEQDNRVYGVGTASGTYAGFISGDVNNFFRIPAAFRAEITGEKIRSWQVFADTQIPYEIIKRNAG